MAKGIIFVRFLIQSFKTIWNYPFNHGHFKSLCKKNYINFRRDLILEDEWKIRRKLLADMQRQDKRLLRSVKKIP